MREHLFRGKLKNKEKWMDKGEWIEGSLVCGVTDDMIDCRIIESLLTGGKEARAIAYEIDPETICEYTGLPDKNGIKIFEGSIVRRTDLHTTKEPSVGFVEYDIENTAFLIHWTDVQNYSAVFPWKDRIEVIGDIFDNPDLLKEGEP